MYLSDVVGLLIPSAPASSWLVLMGIVVQQYLEGSTFTTHALDQRWGTCGLSDVVGLHLPSSLTIDHADWLSLYLFLSPAAINVSLQDLASSKICLKVLLIIAE